MIAPITSSQPLSTNNFAQPSTSSSGATVEYNAFLQLLVSELKNQDPTNPTDSAEYLSQLASFSSVEQQIQINEKLDSLLTASRLGEATTLIGKTVTYGGEGESGVVKSVYIDGSGKIIAKLTDGKAIAISDGIEISNSPEILYKPTGS